MQFGINTLKYLYLCLASIKLMGKHSQIEYEELAPAMTSPLSVRTFRRETPNPISCALLFYVTLHCEKCMSNWWTWKNCWKQTTQVRVFISKWHGVLGMVFGVANPPSTSSTDSNHYRNRSTTPLSAPILSVYNQPPVLSLTHSSPNHYLLHGGDISIIPALVLFYTS